MCGTPYFMPPEVCRGERYDAKADVWAMGVIIYELVALKKPFNGDNINQVFDMIIKRPFDPLP
jgi:NIMA (never in mitosis gene a)-related kinase